MAKITLTAGHSNTDPGAVNKKTQRTEASVVTEFRNIVKHYLEGYGHTVTTDGLGPENLNLSRAVTLISGSKVAIEFHCNAAANTAAQGIEALSKTKDKALSQLLCKSINTVLGLPLRGDRGWKSESSGQHSRLAFVSNGGIILELFFISNDAELAKWEDKKWLVGKQLAKDLHDYLT